MSATQQPDGTRQRVRQQAVDRPDTHEMVVVHRVFRREFATLPRLVRAVRPGDTERASTLVAFLSELTSSLHHHHAAEDELLWPILLERMEADQPFVLRMEEQHERVADLLQRVERQVPPFAAAADPADGEALATTLDALSAALDEHLHDEETLVLPIVEQHITVREWEQLGERGRASLSRDRLLVQLGFLLQDCSPSEARQFLGRLPLPARIAYRLVGRRRYARERARIDGV
jgi:iron-sulfur cluster repair protein YtfE (RIC family)